MNIIFLDMDGVLCTSRAACATKDVGLMRAIDPLGVGMLNALQDRVWEKHREKCGIVVSSTWRHMKEMPALLQAIGLRIPCVWSNKDEFVWRTGHHPSGKRGVEIKEWLDTHSKELNVKRYAILDDDSDMLEEQKPFFVKCDCYDGIPYMGTMQLEQIFDVFNMPKQEPHPSDGHLQF
jgi:hypothetical protein